MAALGGEPRRLDALPADVADDERPAVIRLERVEEVAAHLDRPPAGCVDRGKLSSGYVWQGARKQPLLQGGRDVALLFVRTGPVEGLGSLAGDREQERALVGRERGLLREQHLDCTEDLALVDQREHGQRLREAGEDLGARRVALLPFGAVTDPDRRPAPERVDDRGVVVACGFLERTRQFEREPDRLHGVHPGRRGEHRECGTTGVRGDEDLVERDLEDIVGCERGGKALGEPLQPLGALACPLLGLVQPRAFERERALRGDRLHQLPLGRREGSILVEAQGDSAKDAQPADEREHDQCVCLAQIDLPVDRPALVALGGRRAVRGLRRPNHIRDRQARGHRERPPRRDAPFRIAEFADDLDLLAAHEADDAGRGSHQGR